MRQRPLNKLLSQPAFIGITKKGDRLVMSTETSFFYNSKDQAATIIQEWAVQSGFIEETEQNMSSNKRQKTR